MTKYHLLVIVSIIVSTSICNAAESPVKKPLKETHNLRKYAPGSKYRMPVGAWVLIQDPHTKYTKCEPQPRPPIPPITGTLAPHVSPDSSSHKVQGFSFTAKKVRYHARDKSTSRTRPLKRARRYKNSVSMHTNSTPIETPISPAPDLPALSIPEETPPASPSSPFTPDFDTPATPSSPSSDDASSVASLPSSPLKPGCGEAMFGAEGKFSPEDTAIICQAIHKVLKDRERDMRELAGDIEQFFAQLDSEESSHTLAADVQAFEENYGAL
ncbi:MAG: hypothetical protein ACHQVS_03795 [Candidatus Babeliales bacterium]